MEEFAVASREKALAAQQAGRLTGGDRSRGRRDPQGGTPGSKLGQDPLAASLVEGGRLPAALPSQTSDASAALSSSTSGD